MRRLYWYDAGLGVFLVHPPMASVLLSASVERCFVSRMRDFSIYAGDYDSWAIGEFGYGNTKSWSKVNIRVPSYKFKGSVKFFRENCCNTCKVIFVINRLFVDCCEDPGFHVFLAEGSSLG